MATETTARSLDELAKGLATGTLSRGKALRLVGGALLGAAFASVPRVALADDDCRRLGRECRRDSQCCSRNCIRRGDDKVCACPEGRTRCKDDRCVNLNTNERHCGECFNRCAEGEECLDGMCQGGGCQSGTQECGALVCQAGETCVDGQCVAGGCTLGAACGTCTGEGGSTEFCVCARSADSAGSFCRGPLVACASCCDECGVFNGVNLPVCVQSGNPPGGGCEFYCTTPCHGPDGTTCAFL
jgi:Stigma-specific protein, Stig1